MDKENLSNELQEYISELEFLLTKFQSSSMMGKYLPTEYESEFKRISIEIRDSLDEYFGDSNRYSKNIYNIILNSRTTGMTDGISYAAVSDIIAVLKATIKRIPRHTEIIKRDEFINSERIEELRRIDSDKFDLTRLVRLLEELNIAYSKECYMSCGMICRAILDHVPPIFEYGNFNEVANNYGGKSFKGNILHLQNSLRNIADHHLHNPIRKKEILPNQNQINFSNDLDVLISEIIRLLK